MAVQLSVRVILAVLFCLSAFVTPLVVSGFDTLGRVLEVKNLGDNSVVRVTPEAVETLTEDEARVAMLSGGMKKRVVRNAAGWITRVVENDGGSGASTTYYRYDAAGRLLGVCQNGSFDAGGVCSGRGRSFAYNTLGWLTQAVNPESGTMGFAHDANGKLLTRTAADGAVASMSYDALGRMYRKTYSGARGGSPQTFCFDGESYSGTDCVAGVLLNGVGKLTEARNDMSSSKYLSFDAVGRVKQSEQKTGASGPYAFSYAYNLGGMREQMTMPSSRVVNTSYDGMGRVSGGSWGGAPRSLSGMQYWANGAMKQRVLGNGLTESWTYSAKRWQARKVVVGNGAGNVLELQWQYCGAGVDPLLECVENNGNVMRQANVSGGVGWNHSYSYDGWNRLTGYGESTGAGEGYGFDVYGNRWLTSRSGSLPVLTGLATDGTWFNAKNRMLAPGALETDYYDVAGNQIRVGAMGLSYDGEGRVAGATNTGSGVVAYEYDAEDRRVRSTVSGVSTVYVYEAGGELAAEYGGSTGGSGPEFLTGDPLGSVRLVTDGSGVVRQRRDYGPFGEEMETSGRTVGLGYGTGGERQRFTGKERDAETGLDYFGARYLASVQGRWTSPDAKMFPDAVYDPQSWNKYGYVRNNPLRLVDPDGEDWKDVAGGFLNAFNANQVLGIGRSEGGNSDFRTGQALGDALSTLQGAVEILVGGGGEVGGFALDGTGVGAIAGVPLNVASAGVITHGVAVGGVGLKNLANAAFKAGTEGTYEFPDAKSPGKTYVGQSGNVEGRLAQHGKSGKLGSGTDPKVNPVKGGKTAREVAEQKRINDLGGTKNKPGSQTSNDRNPIGKKREKKIEDAYGSLKK